MSIERHPLAQRPRLKGLAGDVDSTPHCLSQDERVAREGVSINEDGSGRELSRAQLVHELALMCRSAAQSVAPYLTYARTILDDATTQIKTNQHDPVTPFDQATERALSLILSSFIPGSTILGEEDGQRMLPGGLPTDLPTQVLPVSLDFHMDARSLASRVRWIVDPIDGTSNFAAGLTYFATSIAAELDGVVVASAICAPCYEETFWANESQGWLEVGEPLGQANAFYELQTSPVQAESDAVLLTYFPTTSQLKLDAKLAADGFASLAHAYRALRRPGAAALDLAQVAAGRVGVVFAATLKPWDVAAGNHLVRVAGGHVCDRSVGTDLPAGLRPAVAAYAKGLKPNAVLTLLDQVQAQAKREN